MGDKVKAECEACGATLNVPEKILSTRVTCPKCGGRTTLHDSRNYELADEELPPEFDPSSINPEAFNAWKVFEKSKEDSYWKAMWRACLYPWQALGALLFFVTGVPVALALVELLARKGLQWAGGAMANPQHQQLAAGAVVGLSLLTALAAASFFASFLLAVLRSAYDGRSAIPVIDGMNHRSNLAAVAAWAALYFGPGFLVGAYCAEEGIFFAWHPAAIALFVLCGFFAPMGLLCAGTVSGTAGLNVPLVVKAATRKFREYAYLLLVLAVGGAAYLGLSLWAGSAANGLLGGATPNFYVGIPLRILSGMLFMFPPVIAVRALGKFLHYFPDSMPFSFDDNAERKGLLLPQAAALAGVIMVFTPLYRQADGWLREGGTAKVAQENLGKIYERYFLREGGRKNYPANIAELEKMAGGNLSGRQHLYALVPLKEKAKETPKFIWLYETEPYDSNTTKVNVLTFGGSIFQVSQPKLQSLLELMKRYEQAEPEQKDSLYKAYLAKLL